MNTKTITVAVILLLIAATGYYFFNNDQSKTSVGVEEQNSPADTLEDTSTGESGMGSLMGLMGLGQNTMCTFSHVDEGTGQTSNGEFYYDGGSQRFRVDSTTQVDGAMYVTHMINDSESSYVWSEGSGETFAIKMSADVNTDSNVQEYDTDGPNKPLSMDQEVDYDCNSWRVDNRVFIPPADVEFTDMASMMQKALEGMPEGFTLPEGFPAQ